MGHATSDEGTPSDGIRSDWSIQEVARLAGVTSRTLRHYGDAGLVPPSRTGAGGIRYYDADALVRLQRVLLLRGLGLGIPAIAEVLAGQTDDAAALGVHLERLRAEHARFGRRIASSYQERCSYARDEPGFARSAWSKSAFAASGSEL